MLSLTWKLRKSLAGAATTSHYQNRLLNFTQLLLDVISGQLGHVGVLGTTRPSTSDTPSAMAIWLNHHMVLPDHTGPFQRPQQTTDPRKEIKDHNAGSLLALTLLEVPEGIQTFWSQPLCDHESTTCLWGVWGHDVRVKVCPPVREAQGKQAEANHDLIDHIFVQPWHVTNPSDELPDLVIDWKQGPPELKDMDLLSSKDLKGLPWGLTAAKKPQPQGKILQQPFGGDTNPSNFSIQESTKALCGQHLFGRLLHVERDTPKLVGLSHHVLLLWGLPHQLLCNFSLQDVKEGRVVQIEDPHRWIFAKKRPDTIFPDLQGLPKLCTTRAPPEGQPSMHMLHQSNAGGETHRQHSSRKKRCPILLNAKSPPRDASLKC